MSVFEIPIQCVCLLPIHAYDKYSDQGYCVSCGGLVSDDKFTNEPALRFQDYVVAHKHEEMDQNFCAECGCGYFGFVHSCPNLD